MADMEREKQKLQDLLDMGFIHEAEYRQRLADLTGSPASEPSSSPFSEPNVPASPYDYPSYEEPAPKPNGNDYNYPNTSSPSSSYTSSYAYSSSSAASAHHYPASGVGGGSKKAFQPIEPCDCSTSYCRCGLQVPQCLEEDHAQVCSSPAWDTFKCPLNCGVVFGSRVEAATHLKSCSSYVVACKTPNKHACGIQFETYLSWCGEGVLSSDLEQHWRQVHRTHPNLGELQLPEVLDCPVQGCGEHIGERWRMAHHFDHECEAYKVICNDFKTHEPGSQYSYCSPCKEEIKRKDIASHWAEVHHPDAECGMEQIPMKGMRCPNSECNELMDRDRMADHLAHCPAYHPICHWCKEEMNTVDDLNAHRVGGCGYSQYQDATWKSPLLMEALCKRVASRASRYSQEGSADPHDTHW